MEKGSSCKYTFQNLSNHVAQGLCQSKICSTVLAVPTQVVDKCSHNAVNENHATLNLSLLSNHCDADIHPEKRIRTNLSTSKGDGNCKVDVEDKSSSSDNMNNDVQSNCEGNSSSCTVFVNQKNSDSEDKFSVNSDEIDDIDTRNSTF